MAKYTITIEGDFEKGDCSLCPFGELSFGGFICGIDIENTIACPLEEVKQTVPLSEVYRLIAGHSNYHGDSILAAFTCVAEGKEVKPIRPLEEATVAKNATVEGEWRIVDFDKDKKKVAIECAECGAFNHSRTWGYCPACGAKMKGGK